jgi:hypothetical protein
MVKHRDRLLGEESIRKTDADAADPTRIKLPLLEISTDGGNFKSQLEPGIKVMIGDPICNDASETQ